MLHTEELKPGDIIRLKDFGASAKDYRRMLQSLGITKGVQIEVVRFAPMGCPMQVKVRGTALALRCDEARDLLWERV